MALGRVYLETTIVSYLAGRPSRDLLVAAHQQSTSDWWTRRRVDFELFASQLVVEEASAGDPEVAKRRLEYLADISLLALTEESLRLAEKLIADGAVPAQANQDALQRGSCCPRYGLSAHVELPAYRERDDARPNRSELCRRRLRRSGDMYAG